MTRPSVRKFLLSTAFVLALAGAFVADANAATRPHRTTTQATNFLMKRVDSGTANCGGAKTDRPGTGLYRSFKCILVEWDQNGDDQTTAYQLDTRPHGRWAVRVLR